MRKASLIITFFFLLSASFTPHQFGIKAQSPGQFARLSLEEQATLKAQAFWNSKLTKCGDSYYTMFGDTLEEFKGVSITTTTKPLSQADRLNGYEYIGIIRLNIETSRRFNKRENKWGPWVSGSNHSSLTNNQITKYSGQWNIAEKGDWTSSSGMSPVGCKDALNPERIIREKVDAETRAMFEDAQNWGLYVSDNPPFPTNYFRFIYSLKKNYQLKRISIFSDQHYMIGGRYQIPKEIIETIRNTQGFEHDYNPELVALTLRGGWIAFIRRTWGASSPDEYRPFFKNVPQTLIERLERLKTEGYGYSYITHVNRPWQITFGTNDTWLMLYGANGWDCSCSPKIQDQMSKVVASGREIRQFVFLPDGNYIILYGKNGIIGSPGVPQSLKDTLDGIYKSGKKIEQIAVAPTGAWLVEVYR